LEIIFFNEIDKEKSNYLMKLQIPTASSKLKMPDEITEKIYNNLLQERKVKHSMFNLKKIRQAFFKSIERDVIVKPELFKYTIEDDEVYENRRKMTISFFLPRGSYATMLIKRIFAKKPLRRQ
jgi:tRNA pseudouridine13 synthase